MRKKVQEVSIKENLSRYAVNIVEATRKDGKVSCGASPRALLALLRFAQALAYMEDRSYCIPEDIAKAASLTLPHRLVLTTEARMNKTTKESVIDAILNRVSCDEA